MLKTLTAGLVASFLAACSSAPHKTAETSLSEPARPTISAEAQLALDKAESDTREAESKFALWTTTQNALMAAHEAARAGDSAKVIAEAGFASSQARNGLAQIQYPTTEQK